MGYILFFAMTIRVEGEDENLVNASHNSNVHEGTPMRLDLRAFCVERLEVPFSTGTIEQFRMGL